LRMETILICKISPNLPLTKGGFFPSLEKRGEGRFGNNVYSNLRSLISG
jgi:hypothetical protein